MLKELIRIKEGILDILLPKKCVGCGKEGQYICKDCELFLSEVPPSKEVVSVWEYEGLMEKLIWKIKYEGMYDIINTLVEKAFEKMELNLPEDTSITYVPMYKKKEKQRGFNQAELIAKKVGKLTNKEIIPLLIKIKDNISQVGLNPQERKENVKNVFKYSENGSRKNVLLVDDVYTTGATMNECIKVLKKAGIKNVLGFTLARKLSI